MKFKTLRTSETGQKFEAITKRKDEVWASCLELANELNIKQWRGDRWEAYGGMEFVYFDEGIEPDPKIWKKTPGGHQIKRSTKIGKEIHDKMKNLPVVSRQDLNMCIGDMRVLARNLKHFEVRMEKINKNSEMVANYLSEHESVETVFNILIDDPGATWALIIDKREYGAVPTLL